MNCRDVDELGAAYAVDAVDPDERRAIAQHLETCTEAHAEARSSFAALALDLEPDPIAPSPALRQRLMASLASLPQEAALQRAASTAWGGDRGSRTPSRRAETRVGWFERATWLRPVAFGGVAASLVLAVATGVLWTRLQERDAQMRSVAEAIAQGGSTYSVGGDAGTGILVDHADGATVVLAGLSPVGEGQLYELWLLDSAGTPVAVGTHRPTTDQGVVVIPLERDIDGYATFAMTVERARVEAPTTDPVIVGQLEG